MMLAVILAFLHWLLRFYITIARLWQQLIAVIHRTVNRPTAGVIRKQLSCIEKLPVHLSLVFVEDELSFTDIARLVAWSTAAGVAYVTIYDYKGVCKQKKEILLQKFSEERQLILKKESTVSHSCAGKTKNGLLSDHIHTATVEGSARIFIIGPDDGRQGLADIARQLSKDVVMRRLATTDITVSRVDDIILEKYGFPDPDLVLKFGAVESLLGFLPWHMRLSEIISIPTHVNICFSHFIDAIVSFSHTQQRFGK